MVVSMGAQTTPSVISQSIPEVDFSINEDALMMAILSLVNKTSKPRKSLTVKNQ